MQKIKDFLADEQSNEIEETLINGKFPWLYLRHSVSQYGKEITVADSQPVVRDDGIEFVNAPVFRHGFIIDREVVSKRHIDVVRPLINRINFIFGKHTVFQAIQANLLTGCYPLPGWETKFCIPHIDVPYSAEAYHDCDIYTALYYVNECEGDTLFFAEKRKIGDSVVSRTDVTLDTRISPCKNTFVFWDSRIFHSAPAFVPTTRSVVNFNFLVPKALNKIKRLK